MIRIFVSFVSVLILCFSPDQAQAQENTFWPGCADPALEKVRPIREELRGIYSQRLTRPSQIIALSLANRALKQMPRDPELLHMRSQILYDLDRFDEVVRDVEILLEVDREGVWASRALLTQGVALTRLERFEEAALAYTAYLEISAWPVRRALGMTNLAETYMAMGDLTRSIEMFRAAISADPDYTLAYFGLAVALDRVGEQGEAVSAMLHGLSVGRGFEELEQDGLFYVPEWEIHYYFALAYEVMDQLDLARTRWLSFLGRGGSGGPYAERVAEHLAALDELEGQNAQ